MTGSNRSCYAAFSPRPLASITNPLSFQTATVAFRSDCDSPKSSAVAPLSFLVSASLRARHIPCKLKLFSDEILKNSSSSANGIPGVRGFAHSVGNLALSEKYESLKNLSECFEQLFGGIGLCQKHVCSHRKTNGWVFNAGDSKRF